MLILKSNDSNYAEKFKTILSTYTFLEKETMSNKIRKIDGIDKYLEFYYRNTELDIAQINSEELLLQPTTSQLKFNKMGM